MEIVAFIMDVGLLGHFFHKASHLLNSTWWGFVK
jgi:hypothetical protein